MGDKQIIMDGGIISCTVYRLFEPTTTIPKTGCMAREFSRHKNGVSPVVLGLFANIPLTYNVHRMYVCETNANNNK